ncbi:MAG: hypothetical protein IE927_08095 [Rhodobacterales bacterium]|nr:hypothetical protein [Rhodobacterales bacterium]
MEELSRELARIRAEIARLQTREAEVWAQMKAQGARRPGWPLRRAEAAERPGLH